MLLVKHPQGEYNHKAVNNQLSCTIVQQPNATKCAAAFSIHSGSFNDPDDCPGLSHLLEHMLFAGCKAFPDGNHLNALLSQSGGFVNAWTSAQSTNLHFDSKAEQFLSALEVALCMLTQPLFSLDGIEREIHSIDAEFTMRKQDDLRRLNDVHKSTCNPEHPYARFAVGHASIFTQFSLSELQNKLIKLHAEQFSLSNINLVLVLDSRMLQQHSSASCWQFIESCIAKTATGKQAQQSSPKYTAKNGVPLYLPSQQHQVIEVKSHKNTHNMLLSYVLQDMHNTHNYKPTLVLSHLICDDTEQGLAQQLKQLGWIADISAAHHELFDNQSELNISIKLTEQGNKQLSAILHHVLSYIEHLSSAPLDSWRFEEKCQQLALQVKQYANSAGSPVDEAALLSTRLHKMSLDEAYCYDSHMDISAQASPCKQAFKQLMTTLHTQAWRIYHIHPLLESDALTKEYQVPYRNTCAQRWKEQAPAPHTNAPFALPAANEYMADKQHLVRHAYVLQALQYDANPAIDFHFGTAEAFNSPTGDCYLRIESPSMYRNAHAIACKRVWLGLINDALEQAFGHAELAGLYFRVYANQVGITLHTNGFSDKQLGLAAKILATIVHSPMFEGHQQPLLQTKFSHVKQRVSETASNKLLSRPINQLFNHLHYLCQQNAHTNQAVLKAIQAIQLDDIVQFNQALFASNSKRIVENKSMADTAHSGIAVEGLAIGNWELEQVHGFVDKISSFLGNAKACEKMPRRVAQLYQQNYTYLEPRGGIEDACVAYFQAPSKRTHHTALFIAIERLLAPFVFNQLRNVHQLGYLVGSGYMPINRQAGIAIYAQSAAHSATHIANCIEQSLQAFLSMLADLPASFEAFKSSLLKQFSVADNSASQYSKRIWGHFDCASPAQESHLINQAIADLRFDDLERQVHLLCEHKACLYLMQSDQSNKLENNNNKSDRQYFSDLRKLKEHLRFS